MAVKCTECGASIQDDSKFCKYCGAKINPDNVKKIEVRVDNTAEITRAGYEEKESALRQAKMEHDLKKEKRKPYTSAAKIAALILPFVIYFILSKNGMLVYGVCFLIVGLAELVYWMHKLIG